MPWQKYYLSSTKKTMHLLDLLEDDWGHMQKGQRGFTGNLTSTALRLPEAPLAGRRLIYGNWFSGGQVPPFPVNARQSDN